MAKKSFYKAGSGILSEGLSKRRHEIAIMDDSNSLTYEQLSSLTYYLASDWAGKGVKKGARVAILAKKDLVSAIAMVAAMRLGATVVMLDSKAPADRNMRLVEDCNPQACVFAERLGEHARNRVQVEVSYEEISATLKYCARMTPSVSKSHEAPFCDHGGDDIAYMMYTSGSTGAPKGVQISNKALDAFFDGVNAYMDVSSESNCMSLSPLHFDACVVDLLHPLRRGASVIFTPELLVPRDLLERIEKYRISHFAMIMPTLTLVAKSGLMGKYELSSIHRFMTGADVLDVGVIQTWLKYATNAAIVNGYGPTEATCVCIAELITRREEERTDLYPIGKPLIEVGAIIADDDGNEVSGGTTGEILVCGSQVMKGYWNRPDLDADRLKEIGGNVYYRTGDLGFKDGDGVFHFVGRKDEEVKIRGYRIHLNEVRVALLNSGLVKECYVAVTKINDWPYLAAVVSPMNGETPSDLGEEVISYAARRLPDYMVPARIVVVPVLPQTKAAKLDTQRIKSMIESASEGPAKVVFAPVDAVTL